jgi:hypothetical protein
MKLKTTAVAAAAVLLGAVAAASIATPANASGGCSGSLITINSNSGAEPPSRAYGHSHVTGNHYIRAISGSSVIWWADNNGGLNGDTADTYYTTTNC